MASTQRLRPAQTLQPPKYGMGQSGCLCSPNVSGTEEWLQGGAAGSQLPYQASEEDGRPPPRHTSSLRAGLRAKGQDKRVLDSQLGHSHKEEPERGADGRDTWGQLTR